MSLIRPFRGLRPAAQYAEQVIAPPYDVLSSAEARQRAQGKPWSFLHISKPDIDLPEDIDPYDPAVYDKAGENMRRMIEKGVLIRDTRPSYYAYRLIWNDLEKTGIVAAASVAAYDNNRVRKHEHTQPKKEDDRVRQIEAVNAHTGPVMIAYPDAPDIDALLARASSGNPDMDIEADDGIRHVLWVIDDKQLVDEITRAFEALPAIYIADGHHRSAAASRICKARAANNGSDADASYRSFLSVIFPHHQMRILDYNRVITDLNGLTRDELIEKISASFSIVQSGGPVKPSKPGEFGMYLEGAWYWLNVSPQLVPEEDPVGRLDISVLSDLVIDPILGIADQRRDRRIDFVGGIRGVEELAHRVDSGEMAVAFSFFPTSMTQLMAVAEAGEVMPTKSTWFEPKLARFG